MKKVTILTFVSLSLAFFLSSTSFANSSFVFDKKTSDKFADGIIDTKLKAWKKSPELKERLLANADEIHACVSSYYLGKEIDLGAPKWKQAQVQKTHQDELSVECFAPYKLTKETI